MDKYRMKGNAKEKLEEEKPAKNNLIQYRIPISPDRELLIWEKWIHIRKEETIKLGHIFKRPPTDLAMNLLKNERETLERKVALEYAQIEKKPSLRYGQLFEQPQKLKQRTSCEDEPVYEVQRTQAELGRPPVIEHVGVPTRIQRKELGMAGTPERKECPLINAAYLDYRQKREEKLGNKLIKVDPFRPSTSKLIVEGFKPRTPPPKIPRLPVITIDIPTSPPYEFIEGVYAVKINKSVWYKNIPGQDLQHLATYEKESWHENCSSWTYYFNVPVKRIGRGKLYLENLGTVTLRYNWKTILQPQPHIPHTMEQVFFFNKNENILPPGQSREIYFTFVSESPGVYHEFWELVFSNVCFFETVNEKIQIDLYGDSVENAENMKVQVKHLKSKIQVKSLDNMACEILNEVLDKAFAVVPQTYPYKKYLLEAQLFIMKNPVCFYHQTEVAKMKEMFSKEFGGQTWDLSVATWRKEMMSKPYDDRMRLFDALKLSYSDFLKPWYEGDTLLKEKYRAVNNLWIQLANKMDAVYGRLIGLFVGTPALNTQENRGSDFVPIDPLIEQKVRSIFYLYVYDHVVDTIEQCAGVLSSLDSNRWIEFDFCRS